MYRALVSLSSPSTSAGAHMARHLAWHPLSLCRASAMAQRGSLLESRRFHGHGGDRDKMLEVEFTLPDGEKKVVTGYEGQTLLDVCAEQGLPMEGACGGSCACSTCHVYLEERDMDLFQEPTDEENDMIDQAFFPEPTSRLGCQLKLKRGVHDGLKVKMPRATRNITCAFYSVGRTIECVYPSYSFISDVKREHQEGAPAEPGLTAETMASFTPLENFTSRGRSLMPTGIVIDKSCRVYVTQIPLRRIERDGASAMKAEFEVYGPLESYKMFTDRSGRFVGSALCTYRNPADASMAVYCMDGVEVEGSTLQVKPAKEHGVVLLSSGNGSGGNEWHRDHSRGFLPDTQRQWGRGGRGRSGLVGAGQGRGSWATGGRAMSGASHTEVLAEESGLASVDGVSASPDDGKWCHDKYEMMAEGKDMDEVLGIRRPHHHRGGVRGRGGRLGHRSGEGIDSAFEKYIKERDASDEHTSALLPSHRADVSLLNIQADLQPTPVTKPATEPVAEETVTATMTEMAFGADESDAPVTGAALGALPEDV